MSTGHRLRPVQAWKTAGGHILVKPRINGQDVGFMILDTGALLGYCAAPVVPLFPACHTLGRGNASVEVYEAVPGSRGSCPRLNSHHTAGASGLVIERAAADKMQLPCIGEIHVSGVAGKTRSCFRRASSIQVRCAASQPWMATIQEVSFGASGV
jgi:hypothetical protein